MRALTFGIICSLLLLFNSCMNRSMRTRIDFNANWKFQLDDDSLASQPDYNDADWRLLNLPHDWSIEGEFSEEHTTKPAGGALPAGIGWYRKSFILDDSDINKRIYIDFGGIYRNSEVWINGNYLGKRANGYISFQYELTDYLKYNGEKNIIAVKADNSLQPNSRWYTGSGIYRNVWLVKTSQVHIENWATFITTPKVSQEKAIINISTKLTGDLAHYEKYEVKTSLLNDKGKELVKTTSEHNSGNVLAGINQQIFLNNPKLWQPESPYLYQVIIQVMADNKKIDEQDITIGIRYFAFDSDSGFYLNGEPYKIRGVNLHHDLGALGAAVNKRAIERQLEIMKGMGVNAIRTAHNPPAPELLDLCDRMGFLVMDEAYDVWKKKKVKYDYHIEWEDNYKNDLQDLVLRDRNHPSVIFWSIGNEIREQFDSTGIIITKELVRIVKDLDTTRPVICALTETDPNKNFIYQSGALDLLGFNYKHEDWTNFKKNFPGQKMMATENMSAYATRGHYDMPSDSIRYWPEKYGDPIIGANHDYTVSAYDNVCAFWGATHEETLKAYYQYNFISGLFIWCGIDFLGEPVPYEWPAKNSYYGVVDLAGFPKDVYYLYQSIWTDTPTLHIFPHWNREVGDLVDVWAYYNQADEVELFLNGKSLGTKNKGDSDFHVMWRVEYQLGKIKAVSRKDGELVLEKTIRTAEPPAKIELSADRNEIQADGRDLSFITVKILDEKGNMVPYASNLVEFNIIGCGFIAGVDNGYQASHEPFKANRRKAFNGMCLAIIQSNGKTGNIIFKATSDGMDPASITLITR
ncbi:glycoside hydrolase family 2 TIM barrel-domain containing protein [Bacteroidota bacterium]